jgi:GAF domain
VTRRRSTRRNNLQRNLKRLRDSDPASQPAAPGELSRLRREAEAHHKLHALASLAVSRAPTSQRHLRLVAIAREAIGLRRGMLALGLPKDPTGKQFRVACTNGYQELAATGPEIRGLHEVIARCLRLQQPVLQGGRLSISGVTLGAVACLPLRRGGRLIGALLLEDPAREDSFTPNEEALLGEIALHATLALELTPSSGSGSASGSSGSSGASGASGSSVAPASRPRSLREDEIAVPCADADDFFQAQEIFACAYLRHVLVQAGGDLSRAARRAKLPVESFERLVKDLGVLPQTDIVPIGPPRVWGNEARRTA